MTSVLPDLWFEEITEDLTPSVSPDEFVADKETIERFEVYETRALAHARARGEHDSMLYLTLYAIWSKSLWKTKHKSWEAYCDWWDSMPFGVSKSSIKHKIADVDRLVKLGVPPITIVKALGSIPMAIRDLSAELLLDSGEIKEGMIPEGYDVTEYIDEIAELGPSGAALAVGELIGKPKVWINPCTFIHETGELVFTAHCDTELGHISQDMVMSGVPGWLGGWMVERIRRKKGLEYAPTHAH